MMNLVLGGILITLGAFIPPHPTWARFCTVAVLMFGGGYLLLAGALGW